MFSSGVLARTTHLFALFALLFTGRSSYAQSGACCIGTSCTIRTLAACDSAGGEFFDGPCSPNPCVSLAVCCDLSTFGCTLTTSTGCSGLNQRYLPANTSCSTNPCANLGACCNLTSGTCSLLFSSGCSGSFQGRGTLCTPGLCSRACCNNTSLVCTVVGGSSACAGSGGTYLMNTTTCSPDPCPPLAGACCDIGRVDGGCRVTLPQACPPGSSATVFQGVGTTCSPNPCVGACCAGDTGCSIRGSLSCFAVGGAFQGDLTACAPNPCLGSAGACCDVGRVDGGCRITLMAACPPGSSATVFQGVGTTCSPNPCVGACCASDTSCSVRGSLSCQVVGGTFEGNLTVCSPNPCLSAAGACCDIGRVDGGCRLTLPGACPPGSSATVFQGVGTTCTPNPCVGACCNGAACSVRGSLSCQVVGGTPLGNTTVCAPCACAQSGCCPADFNASGSLSVQDIFDFLAAYFSGQLTADFNNSTSVTVQDIFDFLAAYFAGCS